MTVRSVTDPSPTAAAASGATIAPPAANTQLDQQAFLKLLVTQLTNQDPLSPQDQTQYLAQLAQFSTVEGINNLQTSQTHQQAASLIGKSVDALVVHDNIPQVISGKVTAVRWDTQGVHFTVEGSADEISLAEITQVRENTSLAPGVGSLLSSAASQQANSLLGKIIDAEVPNGDKTDTVHGVVTAVKWVKGVPTLKVQGSNASITLNEITQVSGGVNPAPSPTPYPVAGGSGN